MITTALSPTGAALAAGPPGESAYQLWLDNGNTGTAQQYLQTLIGPMGPPGPTGPAGPVGSQGYTGPIGLAPWQPVVQWATSTVYVALAPASCVTYQGSTYVCTTAHTSTASFDSSKWVMLAAQGASGAAGADLSALADANLLLNGFQNVSQQYGTTATAMANGGYATDQWQTGFVGTLAATSQQVASPFPSQPDIPNGLKIAITTAEATLAAGDYLSVCQPLEGTNLARLNYGAANARTVTLVFMVRPSITITGYVSLRGVNNSSYRSFLRRFTAPANTDTFVLLTIPGDQAAALLTTTARSMEAMWCFGSGTTYQAAADTWIAGNFLAGSDVTNLAAAAGNSVILSGTVMLAGSIAITQSALPTLSRQYDDDLRKCQRYFQNIKTTLLTTVYLQFPLVVPVRAAPSLTLTAGGTNGASVNADTTSGGNHHLRQVSAASGAIDAFYAVSARM